MTITDTISNKQYGIKKVCRIPQMPKSASYYCDAYTANGVYHIYRTDAGVLYAAPPTIY